MSGTAPGQPRRRWRSRPDSPCGVVTEFLNCLTLRSEAGIKAVQPGTGGPASVSPVIALNSSRPDIAGNKRELGRGLSRGPRRIRQLGFSDRLNNFPDGSDFICQIIPCSDAYGMPHKPLKELPISSRLFCFGPYEQNSPGACCRRCWPELFPTERRGIGMSLSYSISVTIFGGFAPLMADLADRADGQSAQPELLSDIHCGA